MWRANLRRGAWSVGLLLGACLYAASAKPAPINVGDAFPELAAAGLSGALPVTKGRVAIVDFWASWCAPCKVSFPAYSKMVSEYGKLGLVILGVGEDEKQSDHDDFIKRLAPAFSVVRDPGHALVAKVDIPTTPTCYILGKDGKVRFIHAGYFGDKTDKEIRKEVEQLLAEK